MKDPLFPLLLWEQNGCEIIQRDAYLITLFCGKEFVANFTTSFAARQYVKNEFITP